MVSNHLPPQVTANSLFTQNKFSQFRQSATALLLIERMMHPSCGLDVATDPRVIAHRRAAKFSLDEGSVGDAIGCSHAGAGHGGDRGRAGAGVDPAASGKYIFDGQDSYPLAEAGLANPEGNAGVPAG